MNTGLLNPSLKMIRVMDIRESVGMEITTQSEYVMKDLEFRKKNSTPLTN